MVPCARAVGNDSDETDTPTLRTPGSLSAIARTRLGRFRRSGARDVTFMLRYLAWHGLLAQSVTSRRARPGARNTGRPWSAARVRIAAVDGVVRALDERRRDLGLSKAELARQAGMRSEVVRRILGAGPANPTLATVISLASAMAMDVTISAPADRT